LAERTGFGVALVVRKRGGVKGKGRRGENSRLLEEREGGLARVVDPAVLLRRGKEAGW